MAGPPTNKNDIPIRDLHTKPRVDHHEETISLAPLTTDGNATGVVEDAEPVTCDFLETLFGALRTDIATLKQDITADIKGLTKEMNELGDWVSNLEQTSDAHGEELDAHRCELLDLRDKNAELRSQVEDLKNRSRMAKIRIKGVPLQAAGGNLEVYVRRLFHHIVPEFAPEDIVLDRTHRAGRPVTSLGEPITF
ncbi:hypothetical protein NDU88_006767 [Pleurodeles waltl]|uniref:Uncharacterized protein n=1 Tax=Pleurodeles waltl TaxID=8319 RepID=A0AAV7N1E5_PLEWA|nr:hypothetical protein NDU88_006767 [Pleurodeles waltl]